MFQCILSQFDQLIEEFETVSAANIIQRISRIKQAFLDIYSAFKHHNNHHATEEMHKRVSDYIAISHNDEDFIEKILAIQKKTRQEFAESFEKKVEAWSGILQNKEEQVLRMLVERLAQKPIQLGVLPDKTKPQFLLWTVAHIDPYLNTVQLVSTDAVEMQAFHASGYTHIEDGAEEFGCAELSCGWATSDIRQYLNGSFFQHAFSDQEKSILLRTRRHMNCHTCFLPQDISEDYVYLLSLDEFLRLDPRLKTCPPHSEGNAYWLAEQKNHGWDDGELPTLYAVTCTTGELTSCTGNIKLLTRLGITIRLDALISME